MTDEENKNYPDEIASYAVLEALEHEIEGIVNEIQGYAESHAQSRLQAIAEEVEDIKEECLSLSFDKKDNMEGVISETDVSICFEQVLATIKNHQETPE